MIKISFAKIYLFETQVHQVARTKKKWILWHKSWFSVLLFTVIVPFQYICKSPNKSRLNKRHDFCIIINCLNIILKACNALHITQQQHITNFYFSGVCTSLLLLRIPLPRRAPLFKFIFKFGGNFFPYCRVAF